MLWAQLIHHVMDSTDSCYRLNWFIMLQTQLFHHVMNSTVMDNENEQPCTKKEKRIIINRLWTERDKPIKQAVQVRQRDRTNHLFFYLCLQAEATITEGRRRKRRRNLVRSASENTTWSLISESIHQIANARSQRTKL